MCGALAPGGPRRGWRPNQHQSAACQHQCESGAPAHGVVPGEPCAVARLLVHELGEDLEGFGGVVPLPVLLRVGVDARIVELRCIAGDGAASTVRATLRFSGLLPVPR
jgi:hypothetical protein